LKNHIIITNDYDSVKMELIAEFGSANLRFIERDEILLDDAKAAVKEAYISENSTKIIVLKGDKFGIEAQNSLLLILEESPKNVGFILVGPGKNIFLPTICSRLFVKNRLKPLARAKTGLNYKKLGLKEIYAFLEEKIALERVGKFDKTELKAMISAIFKEALENGIKFSEKELTYINEMMVLADLNAKTHTVLTPLLLMLRDKSA